jgi:hypothetical protein
MITTRIETITPVFEDFLLFESLGWIVGFEGETGVGVGL